MEKYIYKITNLINQKIYIGQTKDYERRFKEHKRCNKNDTHKALYFAFQKYGIDNFSFEVIEKTNDYNEREKYWIKYYNCMIPNGYNMTEGGEEPPRFQGENHHLAAHTQEEINELKELIKNSNTPFTKLAEQFKYNMSSLNRINTGELWFDKNEIYPLRKEQTREYFKQRALLIIDDLINSNLTQKEIAKKYGVTRSTITAINIGQNYKQNNQIYPIRGEKDNCHSRSIIMIDKDTNEELQEFNSIKSAADYINHSNGRQNISKCAAGAIDTAYGYKWKYKR